MTATLTSTVASGSESILGAISQQQLLPETLRLRPLPTPLVGEKESHPFAILRTPDIPVPCRRCLQLSQVGDEMLLLSYDPFLGKSPYQCASPIFVHSKPACKLAAVPSSGGPVPEMLRHQVLSVRAYDAAHMMRGAEVVDGERLSEALGRLLGDAPETEYFHVHYGAPGCFAVRLDKVSLTE
ncbi:hypothetical protein F5Y03DRAFT_392184 [Xylaria venustula]|nr:hypothetical protein F5Y03DRAFT_392184 [Xylaria venustula]